MREFKNFDTDGPTGITRTSILWNPDLFGTHAHAVILPYKAQGETVYTVTARSFGVSHVRQAWDDEFASFEDACGAWEEWAIDAVGV